VVTEKIQANKALLLNSHRGHMQTHQKTETGDRSSVFQVFLIWCFSSKDIQQKQKVPWLPLAVDYGKPTVADWPLEAQR
jgi:hypothetical protein